MTPTDEQLCDHVRDGSTEAFSELWRRHHGEALGYARKLNPSLAEDAVSEAMTSVFASLRAGKGPNQSFRSYLMLSVRNTVYRSTAQPIETELPEDLHLAAETRPLALERDEETSAVHTALEQLPERWKDVLVLTEVQRKSLAEVGSLMGLESNAVSALLRRARSGLRRSWVAAHFSGAKLSSECSNVVEAFGDFRWGKPSQRQRHWFEKHVSECRDCIERQGTHAWLAQAVGLAMLPCVWIGASVFAKRAQRSAAASHASSISAGSTGTSGIVGTGVMVSAGLVLAVGTVFVALPAVLPQRGLQEVPETTLVESNPVSGRDVTSLATTGADSNGARSSNLSGERDTDTGTESFGTASSSDVEILPSASTLDGESTTGSPASGSGAAAPAESTLQPPDEPATNAPSSASQTPAPSQPSVWEETIAGSTRPHATLEFLLSDFSTVTTVSDLNGNFTLSVQWSSIHPTFRYTLQGVRENLR